MFRSLFKKNAAAALAEMTDATVDARGMFRLAALRKVENRDQNLRTITQLCHNAYLGDYRSLCRILGRFEMLVDTRDNTLGTHLLGRGVWEIHVTECLAKAVKRGMTVVDVGANYGYFALLMGALAGPKGKIIAIEANPAAADLLEPTLKRNGMLPRTALHRVAVSDQDQGSAWLRFAPSAMNGRVHGAAPKARSAAEEVIEVPLRTLDSLITPGTRVDVMKVDIEGAEYAMWHGATRVLEENPDITVVMEVENNRYDDPASFYQEIMDAGFKLRTLLNDGRIKETTIQQLVDNKAVGHGMLYLRRT